VRVFGVVRGREDFQGEMKIKRKRDKLLYLVVSQSLFVRIK